MNDELANVILWFCVGWAACVILLGLLWNAAVDKYERYKRLYKDCQKRIQQYEQNYTKKHDSLT